MDRYGSADGFPVQYDLILRDTAFFCQIVIGRFRILIEARFGRRPQAFPITPIIENKYIETKVIKYHYFLQPVTDISGIAVEQDNGGPCLIVGDEPAVQRLSVPCEKIDVFVS